MSIGIDQADPYQRTSDDVREAPDGFRGSLRYLGPGLILSASIVGSGELIATTALGAEAGFAILWLVVFSTLVKVAVQIEIGRWAISNGQPTLTGYNKVPPTIGRIGWINILWILLALSKLLQIGGIVGAIAISCSMLVPLGDGPLEFTSLAFWTVIVVVATVALLISNRYTLIERVAVTLVAVFSVIAIIVAVSLLFTEFSYGLDDIGSGLTPTIPAGALGAAVAMFGLTGVTVDEITEYPYWCIEKGYARWAGPPDGSEEWVRRARSWTRVMYRDAMVSWVVYTVATAAFYVLGAAILHPQGLTPEGNELITTLSRTYTDTLGEWAGVFFLIGAIAVLASSLWAGTPAWSRMYVNCFAVLGVLNWWDQRARNRWTRALIVVLPVLWGLTYLFVQEPVIMVQAGGVTGGVFLVAVVCAAWYLRRTDVDPRLRGGRTFYVLLLISSAAIALLGVYTTLNVFGVTIGE